jgi:hypothetical protein
MSSWVVLLDCSSSMDQPFSIESRRIGRVDISLHAESRLEAAKEVVVELLDRFEPNDTLVLIPFSSTALAEMTFRAADRSGIRRALDGLVANGGTSVALALDASVDRTDLDDSATTAFLVTDGESDLGEAEDAARRCRVARVPVFVYAIDPTEDSELLARRVAAITGGTWHRVFSLADLSSSVTEATVEAQAAIESSRQLESRFTEEYRALGAELAQTDDVRFTIAYPQRIDHVNTHPFRVAVHREHDADTIETQLRQDLADGGYRPQTLMVDAQSRLPIGTMIVVEPRIEGIEVVPRRAEVIWWGKSEILDFRMRAHTDATAFRGFVDISTAAGLSIASAAVSLSATSDTPNDMVLTRTRLTERVFAAYAHVDEAIVLACRQAYAGLGIQLFVDHENINGGERWRDAVARAINQCDLFQLFWSPTSAASTEVRNEWTVALTVADRKPEQFIRPVHWAARDPSPKPPAELEALHFRYLDVSHLDIRQVLGKSTAGAADLDLAHQIAVLPLVEGCDDLIQVIREETPRIVPWIEEMTGLRYHPAPALIVDEYLVRTVRESTTVDAVPPVDDQAIDLDWAMALLQALLLSFHVGWLMDEPTWDASAIKDWYGFASDEELGDYITVRRLAEGGITAWIKARLDGVDGWADPDDGSETMAAPANMTVADTFVSRLTGFADPMSLASRCIELVSEYAHQDANRLGSSLKTINFRLTADVLARARQELRLPLLTVEEYQRYYADSPEYSFSITRSEFKVALGELGRRLISAAVASPRSADQLRQLVEVTAPTLGICALAGTSGEASIRQAIEDAGLPIAMALHGTTKVLICKNAIDRLREGLTKAGESPDTAETRMRGLVRKLLAHEHLHAALAHGLDRRGQIARGARDASDWTKGSALNESLAAWIEIHSTRNDPWLLGRAWEYVNAGKYPLWPYAGAEVVERAYCESGLAAVRSLVESLRSDPQSAQEDFDAIVSGQS